MYYRQNSSDISGALREASPAAYAVLSTEAQTSVLALAPHTRLKPGREADDYSGTDTGLRMVWELP